MQQLFVSATREYYKCTLKYLEGLKEAAIALKKHKTAFSLTRQLTIKMLAKKKRKMKHGV